MNTLIITEAVLIIKGETTVQLRISAVLLRKAGRWDVPYAILMKEGENVFSGSICRLLFIKRINFEQSSTTIKLYPEDEIKDTDESIELFCKKLDQVVDTHLFLKKLNSECLTKRGSIKNCGL